MPTGGRLEIELSRAEFAEVRAVTVGRVLPGSWCCVTIADTGVGLTSEQIGLDIRSRSIRLVVRSKALASA